jgi:Domain of unknown function (DUF4430)
LRAGDLTRNARISATGTVAARKGAAVLAAAAFAAGGCGVGAGDESEGEATLTVTHDYGSEVLVEASQEDPPESETVIRFLDRAAEISTRYGGGFVQSIEGVSGETDGGRRLDWFFFVNGIESPIGSADAEVRGGDRIWWDHRDWTDAMRAPAVVGSWPEPLLQASAGDDPQPVRIECEAPAGVCEQVADRLADEEVDATISEPDPEAAESALRVLVGPWDALRDDVAAGQLDDGPATSGVFARFERTAGEGFELVVLDERAQPARELGRGSGLVAALRDEESPPTWIVTGTDERGVEAAVELLDSDDLSNRYSVATGPDDAPVALPSLREDG